jgi:hypothetical protein
MQSIVASGRTVDVLVGPAGAGKTATMHTLRQGAVHAIPEQIAAAEAKRVEAVREGYRKKGGGGLGHLPAVKPKVLTDAEREEKRRQDLMDEDHGLFDYLYDTLLRDFSPDEVRLVVAHELGHVHYRDVPRGLLYLAIVAPFGMFAVARLSERMAPAGGPAAVPAVALSLWASGGATSFIQPVMIFTAVFIAYFFPPRLASRR